MKSYMFTILLAVILTGCAHRHAHFVRDGLLRYGIADQAFLDVWGTPDRVGVFSNDKETVSANWGSGGGSLFKGQSSFVKWTYEKIGIELYFTRNCLAGWKTDRTVSELKSFAKPNGVNELSK